MFWFVFITWRYDSKDWRIVLLSDTGHPLVTKQFMVPTCLWFHFQHYRKPHVVFNNHVVTGKTKVSQKNCRGTFSFNWKGIPLHCFIEIFRFSTIIEDDYQMIHVGLVFIHRWTIKNFQLPDLMEHPNHPSFVRHSPALFCSPWHCGPKNPNKRGEFHPP